MRRNAENAVRRPLCVLMTVGAVLTMLTAGRAVAQTQSSDQKPAESYATLYLTNLTEAREANDAVTTHVAASGAYLWQHFRDSSSRRHE